ncbi:hypothetical protein NBO_916g0001 [Nosema bombycis CQ1]|uniref:Microsporidial 8TM transmembrane domain-containing protein n=1 Tax=Nosema bombycis (strain CQ1 / CVCC 102059) TaxID=578461 RepID=R0MG57_NOSB1|nr:hypothetical protein NBO_916g0001 [Nosema bombycis CQ1]|eukprot:EOB11743.1 hypothetical protein NBO_916g0001 [Nosema bombycis CQ1]
MNTKQQPFTFLFLLLFVRAFSLVFYLPFHYEDDHFELITDNFILLRVIKCIFYTLLDILTSFILKSKTYLVLSFILPPSKTSLENLLCSLIGSNWIYDDLIYYLLCNFSIFYYPLSLQFVIEQIFSNHDSFLNSFYSNQNLYKGYFKRSLLDYLIPNFNLIEYNKEYSKCHEPSFNILWFFFLHIFEQYSHLFFHYFYFVFIFLMKSVKGIAQLEIICLFRSSTFKHWLLFICKDKDLNIYVLLFIMYKYVEYLLFVEGLANPNFLNWITFVFVSFYLSKKYLKQSNKI